MSADKRRRARVQGGWAAPAKSAPKPNRPRPTPPATAPAWLGKTVDVPNQQKFVYEEPTEELREKPAVRVIDKSGVYDLSLGPSGVSRVRLFYNFISPEESEQIFEELQKGLTWTQKTNVKYEVPFLEPRLTAWYGDLPYRYSGVIQEANTNWHPVLRQLQHRLEENTGYVFNSVLANLYRDGKDSIGWHSDDEPSLGQNPTIASLTFGDSRTFEMRKKPPPEENGDYTYSEQVRIPLVSGSLLLMEGSTQDDWQHSVPREYHDRGPRINLTYRVIYEE